MGDVFKHMERLKYQDEDWQARDEALVSLARLTTDGALAGDKFRDGFARNASDLLKSVVTQLVDLRSMIVKQAVATLEVLMAELGDHASAEKCAACPP